MAILLAHELGHYFQARRYRVPASLPWFIPMPISLVGTMGAFIMMPPGIADRRKLFDIAITGPLAGLVPAVLLTLIGLQHSTVVDLAARPAVVLLGEPILFKLLGLLIFGPLAEGQDVLLHPIAYAGWVGIFITALNLVPIGQLDGGHILYALIGKKSHRIAVGLWIAGTVAAALAYWVWFPMLLLLFIMGPKHPPTADDSVPLGPIRIVLGWLSLMFLAIGFTPQPFTFQWPNN
jgi:membrane-associated protease RseP (regulator of RpoE activity)